MKTTQFNPSQIELDFQQVLLSASAFFEQALPQYKIENIEVWSKKDNPSVLLKFSDSEGDKHELVVSLIQRPE